MKPRIPLFGVFLCIANLLVGCAHHREIHENGAGYAADYRIVVDQEKPMVGRVYLDLPDDETEHLLKLRGIQWGLGSQVFDVQGDGKSLKQSNPGEWIAPAGCRMLHWKIPPQPLKAHTLNPQSGGLSLNPLLCFA